MSGPRLVVAALAVTAAVAAAAAPPLLAQSVLHTISAEPGSAVGWDVSDVGDLDGDGGTDFAVTFGASTPFLRVYSGRTGAVLFDKGPIGSGEIECVVGRADVDGDGIPDFAAGDSADSFGSSGPGKVVVFSGADGSVLLTLVASTTTEEFGEMLALPGDVDGDGKADILVSSPNHKTGLPAQAVGKLTMYRGTDGAVLWTRLGPSAAQRLAGGVSVGDLDLDGIGDVAANQLEPDHAGTVLLLSGADGSVLGSHTGNPGDSLGAVAAMGDVNGDGIPDVGISASQFELGGPGYLIILSGAADNVLLTVNGPPFPYSGFGTSLGAADLDGDGIADLITGAHGLNLPEIGPAVGLVRAYSGASGAILHTSIGSAPYDGYGFSVEGTDDVDGDGRGDFLASKPHNNPFEPPPQPPSQVIVWSSLPGPWIDLGGGVGGAQPAPVLKGSGTLVATASTTLRMTGAPAGGASTLVIGLSALGLPFKGGVMVPDPQLLIPGLPIAPDGTLALSAAWPPGLPADTTLRFQHWIADPSGPAGLVASNGLSGTTP